MQKEQDPHTRLRAQHHDLQRLVDRLRVLAAAPEGILLPHRLHYLLESEVGRLSGALRAHLSFEEQGGYMSVVQTDAPELSGDVEKLKTEHDALRSRLNELAQLGFGDGNMDAYRLSILELIDLISDHEAEENLLLDRFRLARDAT